MQTLIITEKPSVARDFAKALGVTNKKNGYIESKDYIITWSVGHLVTLYEPHDYSPKWKTWSLASLPVIPERFSYKPISGTIKQLKIIRNLIKNHRGEIVIATDAGREGEVIARTILFYCGFHDMNKLKRFWTSQALTPLVVRQEMASLKPGKDYDRLWHAGQARQIADWLVGINITRAATKVMNDLFSVGRVQTAVLALICDRKKQRENFKPEPYWILTALFKNKKGKWKGTWFHKNNSRFSDLKKAGKILAGMDGQKGVVAKAEKKRKSEPPPLLFSLTELQREANKKFGLTAQKTLSVAQDLYEKKKCLSYPRTESKVLGSKNVDLVRKITARLSGAYHHVFKGIRHDLIKISNKRVFNDAKLTDHHAIIPLAPLSAKANENEKKIYDLVLKRFSSAFHPDCVFEQTVIITDVAGESFRTKGKVIIEPGWRDVYSDTGETKKEKEESRLLPPLLKGDPAVVENADIEEKMTKPPPDYTEASLLKDMTNPGKYVSENDLKKIYMTDIGLGTQATRARIIETLVLRKYIIRKKKYLMATEKGCLLTETLRRFEKAAILTSPKETARWEMQLNEIAAGKESGEIFLSKIKEMVINIINEFKGDVNMAKEEIGRCPNCQGEIIEGTKGFGCSNWREQDGGCRFVIWKKIAGKPISHELVKEFLAKGKIGPFNDFISKKGTPFSACLVLVKQDEKWQVKFDFNDEKSSGSLGKCPVCGGEVTEGPKGYGCSNWRDAHGGCKFVIWKSIAQKQISRQIAKTLLEQGKTPVISGFISRKGKSFSASLKLQDDGSGMFKAEFDFD